MSKRRKKIDPNQLSFLFNRQIDEYTTLKEEIVNKSSEQLQNQSFEEACIVKHAIRNTNLSREQMVDAINEYFGWGKDGPGKQLSIHMFNHFFE